MNLFSFLVSLVFSTFALESGAIDVSSLKLNLNDPIGNLSKVGIVPIGGLSGLFYENKSSNPELHRSDKIILWSLTDRGPNSEPISIKGDGITDRILLLPDFSPRLIRLEYDLRKKRIDSSKVIKLTNPFGNPVTGRSNVDPRKESKSFDEGIVGLDLKPLGLDPWGVDPESIAIDSRGFFWVGEEYGPSLLKIAPDGRILNRFLPVDAPSGRAGVRSLPKEFGERELNRGFEALAIKGETLYAFLQSPIVDRDSLSLVRVVAFDLASESVIGVYYYELSMSEAKIGDATVSNDGKIYVLEHRYDKKKKKAHRAIFEVDFSHATNLQIHADKLKAIPANSRKVIDLSGFDTDEFEKLEGLAVLDNKDFLILNDNDFNVNRLLALKESKKSPTKVNSYLFHVTGIPSTPAQ